MSGVESNHGTYRQNLPTRGALELSYTRWQAIPSLGCNYQFGDWLPRLGIGWSQGAFQFQGCCWPTTRALGLAVGQDRWRASLSMDNLQWSLVKTVNLSFAWNP